MSTIIVVPKESPKVIIVGIRGVRGETGLPGQNGSGSGGGGGQVWTGHVVTAPGSINFDYTAYNWLDMNCNAGNQIVVLPDLNLVQGKSFIVKRTNTSNFTITIMGFSGQTIDGDANVILYDRKEELEITAINTTDWRIS